MHSFGRQWTFGRQAGGMVFDRRLGTDTELGKINMKITYGSESPAWPNDPAHGLWGPGPVGRQARN